ncbi:acyltransferase family protein [Cyclobacterium marinum]|uniref:acyltransferase family protein n=1 Tax=Cyclobacterium marinum TaxID=104 RepID=UPI0018DDB161|nr:acyltransferase family protein [Cyclobacterium marinum]MBI0397204.1 acyltransferase family protein [Cyclobacterium marinum]
MEKRLKNIDFFKGFLIILVIIGHIPRGPLNQDETIWRSIIYSFHMPLFIGISGFLFNSKNVEKIDFKELFQKFQLRVVIPWMLAVIIYFLFHEIYINDNFSIFPGIIKSFIIPYYHLWFVPAFLSWVFLTWGMKKVGIKDKHILLLGFLISMIFQFVKESPSIYQNNYVINFIVSLVLHVFRPYFFVFFVWGYFYRNLKLKRPVFLEYLITIIFFIILFYFNYERNIIFYIFNLLLLNLTLKISSNNMVNSINIIELFGKNSLGFYLWHVIPILIVQHFVGTNDGVIYYIVTIFLELLFFRLYFILFDLNF